MGVLNLFKRATRYDLIEVVEEVVESVVVKGKTTEELIEEIHENFYTEVDRLLEEAKISRSLDTDKQDLIDKYDRLKKLGFTNTKEVKKAEAEIERLRKLKEENEEKKILIEAIEYFSLRYPQYKFITEDSVLKICQKYNLVYGEISRYVGDVPEKNLKHIEQFRVDVEDECFLYKKIHASFSFGSSTLEEKYVTNVEYKIEEKWKASVDYQFNWDIRKINMKCPLEIAAPVSDFNTKGMEVKDFKLSEIEIPDPVVLKPIIFGGQKHYLIVTAWGEEASDDIVVNEKMN